MSYLPIQIHSRTDVLGPAGVERSRLVAAFLSGRSPRTLEAYAADLEDFRAFVGATSRDQAANQLTAGSQGEANAIALAYRTHLLQRGLAPATVNRRLAALRSIIHLGRTLGLVTYSLEVQSVKAERYRDTRGPGSSGVRLMLTHLEQQAGPKALRDRAILRLLFDLGLRRAEVSNLLLSDLDLASSAIHVLGKGRSQRERLTLPVPTLAALSAWVEVRGTWPGCLFTNFDRARKAGGLSPTSIYRIVRGVGSQVGLKVRPHGLRHAAITAALDITAGDVRAVQRFSRHRDIKVLTVYDDCRRDLGGEVARRVAEGL